MDTQHIQRIGRLMDATRVMDTAHEFLLMSGSEYCIQLSGCIPLLTSCAVYVAIVTGETLIIGNNRM